MNIGIRAARGQWILRLDAHSEYPPDYLALCVETSRRTGADNVGGVIINVSPHKTNIGKVLHALTTHRFGVGNSGFRVGSREGLADTVPFGCFRRDVFDRIGFYDERLIRNQDYELNRRLANKGGRIWLNPAIQIRYYNQSSLSGLLRQAFATGKWNVWMWFVAPYSFAWRHVVPLGFVVALLTTLPISIGSQSLALGALGLMLLASVASFQQAMRHGIWMLPFLPFLFFTYHVAYGLGGIQGLILLSLKRSPVQLNSQPWASAGIAGTAWNPQRVE
jgi:glycosyltransferase involved in cell wall biosynthesis